MINQKYQEIKTFTDACLAVGVSENLFYQVHSYLSKYLLNVAKLEIINKSINGNWSPNWNSSTEYKYYPYFSVSVSSGFSFSVSDYNYNNSNSNISSRFC